MAINSGRPAEHLSISIQTVKSLIRIAYHKIREGFEWARAGIKKDYVFRTWRSKKLLKLALQPL